MNPPPKTVDKTNGKRGRPKPPFDPYVDELNRVLEDNDTTPPPNITEAAKHLQDWGKEEPGRTTLRAHGVISPLQASAIRKRLDKRFDAANYRRAVVARIRLITKSASE